MTLDVASVIEYPAHFPGGVAHKSRNGGVAPIKAQYILTQGAPSRPSGDAQAKSRESYDSPHDDDAAEEQTNPTSQLPRTEEGNHRNGAASSDTAAPPANSAAQTTRISGAQRKRLKKQEAAEARKKNRGMNTNRRFEIVRDDNMICNNIARGRPCLRHPCKFSHSIATYLESKPKDIRLPRPPSSTVHGSIADVPEGDRAAYLDKTYSASAPFVLFGNDDVEGIIDVGTMCPVVAAQQCASSSSSSSVLGPGEQPASCYAGWTCRFLGGHARYTGGGQGVDGTGWELVGCTDPTADEGATDEASRRNAPDEINWIQPSVAKSLRTRKYNLYRTKAVLERLQRELEDEHLPRRGPILIDDDTAKEAINEHTSSTVHGNAKDEAELTARQMNHGDDDLDMLMNEKTGHRAQGEQQSARVQEAALSHKTDDCARIRPGEKRRLDWFHDELYLAPLTTTGNLPFRRLCVSFGADITCGEMGLAESFLQGNKNEWSLVRKWQGERCFGTQLCGSKPDWLVPTAEALAREFQDGLDFIDVNCGCPIDMVFNRGGGSALLDHQNKLGRIVRGMSAVTGDVPITVKLRTGTTSTQTTHKLFPKLKVDLDVGAATLHGRSRQQRYKHLADWDYIRQCTSSLRESITRNNEERPDEDWVHPIPIYGNGDVYSWQDYEANKALTGVDGQMLARGALIKPWLFTEIKERRDWDISSRERLDVVRQLSSYGLTHWGSDSMGVNQTRRFVCEALSFMHRYIPVGLLESLPVAMNDRPQPFVGRNDLETLLASNKSQDWVRISEMFLGKAPQEWSFIPKHKSNAYDDGSAENQG